MVSLVGQGRVSVSGLHQVEEGPSPGGKAPCQHTFDAFGDDITCRFHVHKYEVWVAQTPTRLILASSVLILSRGAP
jgi:hypothetical protein